MRMILTLLVACCLVASAPLASAADTPAAKVTLQGILVSASKQPGKTDGRLSAYEATLRRILRFETFTQLGAGRGRADVPGEGTLSLGQGHQIAFTTEASKDDRLRVQITWTGGGHTLMRTGLVLRPGVPAVLGGPSRNDDEVYAVILVAQ